jgi:hypothetical protein
VATCCEEDDDDEGPVDSQSSSRKCPLASAPNR